MHDDAVWVTEAIAVMIAVPGWWGYEEVVVVAVTGGTVAITIGIGLISIGSPDAVVAGITDQIVVPI